MLVVQLVVHHLKKMQSLQNYRSMVVIHILALIGAACYVMGTTLPSHDVAPFFIAKGYHKEIKPDAGMLQMEVQCRYDTYGSCINGTLPHPKNWSKPNVWSF